MNFPFQRWLISVVHAFKALQKPKEPDGYYHLVYTGPAGREAFDYLWKQVRSEFIESGLVKEGVMPESAGNVFTFMDLKVIWKDKP